MRFRVAPSSPRATASSRGTRSRARPLQLAAQDTLVSMRRDQALVHSLVAKKREEHAAGQEQARDNPVSDRGSQSLCENPDLFGPQRLKPLKRY